MSVLLVAEHDLDIKTSALQALTAAKLCDTDIDVLLIGPSEAAVSSAQTLEGVRTVLVVEGDVVTQCATSIANFLQPVLSDYTHLLMAASSFSKDVLPRLAALCQVAPITDVVAVVDADKKHYQRYMYAGNVLSTVCSHDKLQLLSVRATTFFAAELGQNKCPVKQLGSISNLEGYECIDSGAPDAQDDMPDLASASCVISGGRGLKDQAQFQRLEAIAKRMGAALGASRAAVDAQLVPNDRQVGQTGQIVAPAVYFAVGISGAIQHIAGMKDSQIVVVINKDEDAPILDVADYALIADIEQVLPEWEEALKDRGL